MPASANISAGEIKEKFIELVKTDEEFRLLLIGALSSGLMTKTEYHRLIEEIKNLREDFNKGFFELREEMLRLREDFNKRFEAYEREMAELRKETIKLHEELARLREDFNKRFEAHEREIRNLWEELKKLREDMQRGFERVDKQFERMHRLIGVLGGRWGVKAERAFRDAIIDLVEQAVGAKVKRIVLHDDTGMVYGEPSDIEIDLAIQNKRHILVEIKSRIRKSDVTELLRIGELYKKEFNVDPLLYIVAPEIDRTAYEFAIKKDIKVYSVTEDGIATA